MTTAFVDGARLMAATLGAPRYAFAIIEHPISSASDAELAVRAAATLQQAHDLLITGGPHGSH